jgi:ABC-type nitrate/sulfonate/bicarbonate transport system ATPase subunit
MCSSIIEVKDFTKKYGDYTAVDQISFSVKEGEIFGLLGPNGAGKTSTLECLEGLRKPGVGSLTTIWRTAAVISSILSSLLLIAFWHPWLPVGIVINMLTLLGLLVLKWPPASIIGS